MALFLVCGENGTTESAGSRIATPSHPRRYPANMTCDWRIYWAAYAAFDIKIHAFNTEQCCDIMTVSRLDDQCSISDSIYLNLS